MQKSPIEWTDYTTNPFRARHKETGKVGWQCVEHGPGCLHCYSRVLNGRFGTQTPFTTKGAKDVELFLDEKELWSLLKSKKSGMVFPCDMTDLFWQAYPDEWLDRFFAVVAVCSNFHFQVLTKRAFRLPTYFQPEAAKRWARIIERDFVPKISPCLGHLVDDLDNGERWPLPNLWLGVSVENQRCADERLPHLLNTDAALRFLSLEPLLGRIELRLTEWEQDGPDQSPYNSLTRAGQGLGWLIVGGESGPRKKIRPCNVGNVRSIVEQGKEAGIPVFVKQLGSRPWIDTNPPENNKRYENWHLMSDDDKAEAAEDLGRYLEGCHGIAFQHSRGGDWDEWTGDLADLRVREFPHVEGLTHAPR